MVEEYKTIEQTVGPPTPPKQKQKKQTKTTTTTKKKKQHHHHGLAAPIITFRINIGLYIIACSIITYLHITSTYSIVIMYTSIYL